MLTGEFSKIRGCEHAWLHNAVHSSHKPSYAIRARASPPHAVRPRRPASSKQLQLPCARPAPDTRVRWLVFPAGAWQSGLVEQGHGKDRESARAQHGRNPLEAVKLRRVREYEWLQRAAIDMSKQHYHSPLPQWLHTKAVDRFGFVRK